MKTLMRYLAQNALLITLIIIATYQQYQLSELTRDVYYISSDVQGVESRSDYAGHYAKAAYDEALTAAIKGKQNSDRLIGIEAGLTVGTFQTNCSN